MRLATLFACSSLLAFSLFQSPLLSAQEFDAQAYVQQNDAAFKLWLTEFKSYAISQGIKPAIAEATLKQLTLDPQVIKLDHSQPEFSRPVWEYLAGATAAGQVSAGKKNLNQQRQVLAAISQQYQVDAEVIVAIWGMESGYGTNIGKSQVLRSLATLAYEGRRRDFWQQELVSALKIIQAGDRKATELVGSWAGAMGQTQFMPSTFLQLAVDFDGDGKRNIWTSKADALASTANYLKHHKWQYQIPWGMEVKLPKHFDYAKADGAYLLTVGQWKQLGVTGYQPIDPKLNNLNATLFAPAGYRGPSFLLLDNFRVIMRYNNSTAYALAIALLSDQFKGKSNVQASWPTDDRPLSRSERIEMQESLNALGYSAGNADSIIGINTRQAIQRFQLEHKLIPDSYASASLLQAIRQAKPSTPHK